MADDKKCFVIMPITVPPGMEDKYGDDLEHFGNVYECLFKPSVEVAGYVPIPPKAAGSENIQASIIKNLETADLVLCDMSCLNPNVFFEWGIRTSLNKPVCVVKDELTKTIPFDVGTLHCEDYSSRLGGWKIKKEREKLRDHLRATVEKSGGGNELWQHFGLKEAAQVFEPEKGENGRLAYLAMQMEVLQQKVDSLIGMEKRGRQLYWPQGFASDAGGKEPDIAGAMEYIRDFMAKKKGWVVLRMDQVGPREIRVAFRADHGTRSRDLEAKLRRVTLHEYGVGVRFACREEEGSV